MSNRTEVVATGHGGGLIHHHLVAQGHHQLCVEALATQLRLRGVDEGEGTAVGRRSQVVDGERSQR